MIELINETKIENVPYACQKLLPDIIEAYQLYFSESIQEIRLLGSVPRGDLIPGVSDIDFLCILKEDTEYEKPKSFIEIESKLRTKFQAVQKFDLDITNEKFIKQNFDYNLLIMTDSISIYGTNFYWTKSYAISAEELASLWNPDSNELLRNYAGLIKNTNDADLMNETAKLVGKDLLKSYRPALMIKFNYFSRSIEKTAKQLIECFSEHSNLFELLFQLYSNPKSRKNIKEKIKMIEILNKKFLESNET
jgi:predicted nucleotidyltransferase